MKKVFYLLITLLLSQHALAIDTITWIGGVSDDWTNTANWSAGRLPTTSELVNINASSQRNLVIYSGTSITVSAIVLENTDKSLIINSGATLTGTAGYNYMIYLGQGTSLTNNGTINYTTTGALTEVPFLGSGTGASNFINNGTINVNSNDAVFGVSEGASMNITNNGTITITQAKFGFYGEANLTNNGNISFNSSFTNPFVFKASVATVINNACGKFIASAGFFESKTTTNAGYMQIAGLLKAPTGQTITNTGVLIYGSLETSHLNNTGNSAVIVNNRAYNSSLFTFGGTFNGTIHGIYTDLAATISAGTLNASNVFVPSPSLAAGELTLYAKITPGGAACEYIVPFTYNKSNEIEIRGNNVTISNGLISTSTANNTDFGSQSFFSGTIVKTFKIYNKGNSTLTLTGTPKVTISGTNPSDFTVTVQPASPIAAENDSTTFDITFDPSAGGARVAQVNIANDDANENPYTFRIQGTGTCDGPTGVSVNKTVICSGESISLSATCTIGTITWYNQSAGGTPIGTGSPLSYAPSSSRSYYATCNSGVCESSRVSTSLVSILSSSNIPTGVSVDRTTICLGGSVVLSATCALGTITWYNQSAGGTAIGTGTSLSQSPTINTTYYVACNNTNCESNRVATSQIVIGSNPTASISYPANPYHITAGATNVTLTGTSGGTFTSAPTGLSIDPSSGQITPGSSNIGIYTVTYTMAASGGCSSATSTTSVTITSVPIVTLTSNNNPASIGANVQLTATIIPITATGTVTFKDGTTIMGTATLSSGVARFNTSLLAVGMYTITAEYGGDGSNVASTSSAVSQVVNALTEPKLSFITQSAGSSGTDEVVGKGVVVDASGNVYKTGYFKGTVTFGNATLASEGNDDIFIVKYNSSGVVQWAKRAGGTGDDSGNGIAVSGTDIYITGQFQTTANFNTPSASGSNEIVSAGSTDVFAAKYNDSGTLEWIKRAGGTSIDIGNGITILGTDVYITGSFLFTANFNTPSAIGTNQITSAGGTDIFLAKYNSSGDIQWLKRGGGTSVDAGLGISASGTNVYITGYIALGTANFNTPSASGSNEVTSAGSHDIFIAGFNTSGNLQWVKRAGGTALDRGNGIIASGDYLYITGYFFDTSNFNNPSASGSNEITSAGGGDMFIAKYDNSGTFQWAKRGGANGEDEGFGLAVIGTNVYLTGRFTGTANFNTPSANGANEIESADGNDIFMAEYDETGNYQWAKRAGGAGIEEAGYALGRSNTNLYVTGSFKSTANFNNPSATGSNALVSVGVSESFLASYSISDLISTTTTFTSNNNPASLGANVLFTATVSPSATTGNVTFKEGSTVLGTAAIGGGGVARFNYTFLTAGSRSITAEYGGDGTYKTSTSGPLTQVVNALTAPKLSFIRQSAGYTSGDDTKARAVAIDESGNIYKTGSFKGVVSFGGITLTSEADEDMFVVKYNAAGVVQWAKRGGGGFGDSGNGIAVSGSDVYVAGTFNVSADFNTPWNIGSNLLVSEGEEDIFVVKYNSSGDLQWVKRAGSSSRDVADAVAVSGTDVYITGAFSLTANFNTPSNVNTNLLSSAGQADMFLAKFNSSGDFQWAKRGGGSSGDGGGKNIAISGTNIYIVGGFQSIANFNTPSASGSNEITSAGSSDIFIAKYTTAGDFQWARRAGGTESDGGGNSVSFHGTDIYITGGFSGTANFNTPSASGSNELVSAGETDIFLAKYSDSGEIQWVRRAGSDGGPEGGLTVATSNTGVYVSGTFYKTANFNTPSATGSNEIISGDLSQGENYARFLARYNHSGDFLGAKGIGGVTTTLTTDMVLSGNDLYLVSAFKSAGNFNYPSAGGSNELIRVGTFESLLAKYDVSISPSTTTLASNNNPANVSANVQLTATVSPSTATGTVTFKEGSTVLGTASLSGGIATFTTNTLTAGTHTITAEFGGDFNFSASTASGLSQVINCESPTISITGSTNLTCTTTSVTRTASGGNSYAWSNSLGTNAAATITSPGTYTVTVTGANGCTATATTSVTQNIVTPTASITGSTNLTCTTTSVTRTASGGNSYLWSNSLGTNAAATISSPGTYTVTLTGANGCTATATTTVSQDASLPTASITGTTNLTCTTTSVTRTASGGNSYAWSNSLGTNAAANISSAGTYTVTVTGANGCTATATTAVTQDASVPTASITGSTNLTCTTTSVTRTASGGNSYVWSNSLGTNAAANISSAGTYTVTVTGANGCTATATTTVTQDASLPTANITGSTNLTCTTTSVTRTASGGNSYLWSNSLGTNAAANISSPGTYTVTVTGANGCTAIATTTVTQDASLPTASITGTTNLTCTTTSVTRTASGGNSYVWSNSLGTNAVANISSAGTYTVTVTGANGCTATATTTVTQDASLPTASITGSTNLTCTTTSVTRTASGGNSYLWSNSLGTNAVANISSAGTYTVTVTGTNGCTATATTTVTQDASLPTASITGSTNLTCTTTSVTRTASGGNSYVWSNSLGTNATANISSAGTYTVTVTGTNGCTATATTTVTQDASVPTASITGSTNLTCTTTSVTRTASGGNSYLWSNSLGTNALANISSAGTYTVTVTGANGCTATATTSVTQDIVTPTASITGTTNLSCTTTSVTRTVSGGNSYAWSNSLGTNALANISSAGTYTVTVTGANGCTATATTTVTQDASLPTAIITGTTNLTCTTTSVTRTASGGGTYLWSNSLGTNAAANISSAGTYTVTVTGANGCTTTATTTVTQDASLPTANITGSTNLTCTTTTVTRTASGGNSYLWSNSLGTNALANISSAGTYTVTVTGANGCTATATTTVTQDASLPTANITGSTNLTCTTTSVTRTASGGNSYAWSNSLGTNAVANISSAGTYTVTVTGANGCTATATTTVTQDASVPTANITGSTNLTCTTTSVTRTASGGNSYLWSNSLGTNAAATISTPGTYTVTVTGANGCTATATTTVTQDTSLPTASITGSTNLSCTTTSVTRTASGGNSYAWSNSLGTNAAANISSPGTYTVTVTGANGCTATATTTVTQDIVTPTASITGSTNLTCTTTSVTRTASGGNSYAWSNSLGTNAVANISSAGTYTVTVTGANGCTATATTTVTQDASLPTANITGSTNLTCTTTSVTRTASGGNSYLWSSSLGTNAVANISSPGTYTVTVTGANGCTATATTTVTQDASLPTANITGSTNLTCTTTSVTRTASGGNSYLWSNSLGTNAAANITSPGTYTVTVTGANGCTATATTSVTQDIVTPTASITGSTNLTCTTTSVTRTASGGNSYLWSNSLGTNAVANISSAGTYTVTVTGANGCTATATTTVTQDASLPTASITGATNLTCTTTSVTRTASGGNSYEWSNSLGTNAVANISSAGTYTVTVTGANGCTATATTTVTQDASLPTANITGSTNLTCTTTSVTRTASGGNSYLWSNSLGTNAAATISSPGTYTVTVTGANGCTAIATTTVTQDASVPTASITGTTNLTCTTTSVTRTANGGNSYVWSNSLGTNAVATISSPGTYTVTVTGANGCTATATTTVTQDASLPTAIITGTTNLTCTTTSVTRTASGGNSYAWSNSLGTNAAASINSAGTYTVTITGANGCTATATTTVTQDASLPTAIITGTTNLTCTTTSVTRTASGGNSYAWSNSLGTNAAANISSAGTYTVTVTGANGCTATATTTVTQDASLPTASITGTTNLTCTTTSVTRTASGGNSYAWSNSLGTNGVANISSAGTYTVTVTGANGCTATATTTVTQDASLPTASITGTTNLTCTTTSVTRTASGGNSYLWSNSLGTNAVANISSAGTYTVTVTGANGCTATATTTVTQEASLPTASITGTTNLTCTTTSVTRTASGGNSYAWSNGLGTNAIANISSAGTYTITVTGANGCTATATTTVSQDASVPTASITGSTNLTCTTTSVTRTASGGNSYLWSNSLGTNAVANISSAGTYTVTVTGANGCTATATTRVTQNLSLTANASNTGPYNIGLTIQLNGIVNDSETPPGYSWVGPASFASASQNPTISNALSTNSGTYTLTVVSGICTATATTNVIVNGIDPCVQILDLQYVKAGNPFEPMFSLKDGMLIQQIPEQVSILAKPICPSIPIGSVDLTITGPEINWTILQNVEPFAVFDNLALNVYGRNFIPGTYTMTVMGYAEDNRAGGTVYGPVVTTFTVVGTMAVINAPVITNNRLCAGGTVEVSFAITGSFSPDNTFNIQLSDTTGGFTNPILIGTSATAGTINCQLPQNLSSGGNYLIRVASSSQVVAGNPTMQYLSVTPASRNLTATINTGTITEQASMQISADNKITSAANVTYNAGKAIVLNPGFESGEGSVFKAQIQGCNN